MSQTPAFELPLSKAQYTELSTANDVFMQALDADDTGLIELARAAGRQKAGAICALHGLELLDTQLYSFTRLRGGRGSLTVINKPAF